jgi:hypothetical protein
MKPFASQADLKPKKITFRRLSKNAYAFTTEGDPNTGIVVGDDGVMVIDAQATPLMACEVLRRVRRVTSKDAGDGHLEEWPNTLERLRALKPRIWTAKRDRELWKSIA